MTFFFLFLLSHCKGRVLHSPFSFSFSFLFWSLFPSPSSLLSPPFPFFFFILFGNTTKPAPVSALHWHSDFTFHNSSHSDFTFHNSGLFLFPCSLLSLPFPFFFIILFGNTTKTAPVSALHRPHVDFRFHDSSLSFSPSPLPFPFLFLILFGNTANTALVSAIHRRHVDFSFHESSLSPSPLLPHSFFLSEDPT